MIETGLIRGKGFEFLRIKVRGTLTGAVVCAGMEALNAYDEYSAGIPVLWDLLDSDLSDYTMADIETTNHILQLYPGRKNARIATLVPDPGALLLGRLWMAYGSDKVPQYRCAFLNFDDALAWLASGQRD